VPGCLPPVAVSGLVEIPGELLSGGDSEAPTTPASIVSGLHSFRPMSIIIIGMTVLFGERSAAVRLDVG
jgi:hypothetical protein